MYCLIWNYQRQPVNNIRRMTPTIHFNLIFCRMSKRDTKSTLSVKIWMSNCLWALETVKMRSDMNWILFSFFFQFQAIFIITIEIAFISFCTMMNDQIVGIQPKIFIWYFFPLWMNHSCDRNWLSSVKVD